MKDNFLFDKIGLLVMAILIFISVLIITYVGVVHTRFVLTGELSMARTIGPYIILLGGYLVSALHFRFLQRTYYLILSMERDYRKRKGLST